MGLGIGSGFDWGLIGEFGPEGFEALEFVDAAAVQALGLGLERITCARTTMFCSGGVFRASSTSAVTLGDSLPESTRLLKISDPVCRSELEGVGGWGAGAGSVAPS